MSRTNETSKCKCRLDAIVCNDKQLLNKCRCERKELTDKSRCDNRFI